MMKKCLALLTLLPALVYAEDTRTIQVTTSVILDSVCVPAVDGQGYLHLDEDISGLVVTVRGDDGTEVALYDDPTEFEDIAVIGTYAAPSANNVRVSPQNTSGGDCTQMMFADAIWSGQKWVTIIISDAQTTLMDWKVTVIIEQPF
jgi:hypothetical protein